MQGATAKHEGSNSDTIDLTNLSEKAKASIADLDDHPVQDNDAARAERMLAALESIPENERLGLNLDEGALRAMPLAERLTKLNEMWAVRQQELREAYDAMPKVNEILTARLEVLQNPDASESALVFVLNELEDLLSDIDMARDFHTLAGLPILASMLSKSQPEPVREVAAWAIGTAVKNEPEYQLWVLEVRLNQRAVIQGCPPRSVRS